MGAGEWWLVLVGFLTAGVTLFLAIMSFWSNRLAQKNLSLTQENISLMREIFIKTNRPWIDIRAEDTVLNDEKKLGQVTLVFVASGSHVPEQNISCLFKYAINTDPSPREEFYSEITSGNPYLSSIPPFVLLPGETRKFPGVTLFGGADYDRVVKNYERSILHVYCNYVMEQGQKEPFITDRRFELDVTGKRYGGLILKTT
jgi:hypothetical protein